MSPGARGDFLTDRPAPGRRDVGPPKPQYAYPPPPYYAAIPPAQTNTWLGVPLISMANPRRSGKSFIGREDFKRRDDTCVGRQAQLSKMAMHAQGAPLIIQNRYNNNQRKFIQHPDVKGFRKPEGGRQYIAYDRCDKPDNTFSRNSNIHSHSGRTASMDAVSVASDESSSSNNSEAALPRIIKPRKRRKKDRKPNNLIGTHEIVSRKHDVNDDSLEPKSPGPNNLHAHSLFEDSPNSLTHYQDLTAQIAAEVKPYSDGLLKNYQFSGLKIADDFTKYVRTCETESVASVCQCRYCDPSGQIWEIDSFNFSELFDESSTVDFAPTKLEDSMKVVGSNSKKTNEVRERDTTLRRSWSDPSSSQSIQHKKAGEETSVSNENSVSSSPDLLYSLFSNTPLTPQGEGFFSRNVCLSSESHASSYRLVPELKLDMRLDCPSINLEVSSEIVTSLNGHRDLEIKFFSTSPPASANKIISFFDDSIVNSDKIKCFSDNSEESSKLTVNTENKANFVKEMTSETESEVT